MNWISPDRDRLLEGGDHGAAFVSGEPKKSLLFLMLAHEKKPGMPYKEAKLSDEIVRHFAAWIENGAPTIRLSWIAKMQPRGSQRKYRPKLANTGPISR